jgi:hypothetical protein
VESTHKRARLAALWVSESRGGNIDLTTAVLAGWNIKVGIHAVGNKKTIGVLKAALSGVETTDRCIAAVENGRPGGRGGRTTCNTTANINAISNRLLVLVHMINSISNRLLVLVHANYYQE